MSLEKVRQLIQQRHFHAALVQLKKINEESGPIPGSLREWANIVTATPFSYLALEAARREVELFGELESKNFLADLTERLKTGRERSSRDYPVLSLIGFVKAGTEQRWKRCIDSLYFQFHSRATLLLVLEKPSPELSRVPDFVTLVSAATSDGNIAHELEQAIRAIPGEVFSVIESPDTIFSDHGLLVTAAAFKSAPSAVIIQTERLCYGIEGVATPVRNDLPTWSRSILLDPVNLENPTVFFDWSGIFMRRQTVLEEALPFDSFSHDASAFDIAAKLSRRHLIHSLRVPVILANTPLVARSYQISATQKSGALSVIAREKTIVTANDSLPATEIVEMRPPDYNFFTLPKIAPAILLNGERAAPPITLVTPSFNDAPFIERCIDSILSQNYPALEYMILDGGSTDGTVKIIKKYEKYLSFWRSHPDQGHYSAVQEGLARSRGSIMSWLNSDDALTPYTLRLIASIMSERPQINWITGPACLTHEGKGDLDFRLTPPFYDGDNYFEDGFDRPFIQQEGTFWRRTLWEKTGGTLDLALELAADMELWTRFFQHTLLYSVSVPLGIFTYRKGQRSAEFRNRYYHEAYSVIQRLKSQNLRAFKSHESKSTMLDIPVV